MSDDGTGVEPERRLALDKYRESANIQTDDATWEEIQQFVQQGQMPPEDLPPPDEPALQTFRLALRPE